jgi:hypothetical protein
MGSALQICINNSCQSLLGMFEKYYAVLPLPLIDEATIVALPAAVYFARNEWRNKLRMREDQPGLNFVPYNRLYKLKFYLDEKLINLIWNNLYANVQNGKFK